MIPISRILAEGRAAGLPVARREGELVRFSDFERDVASLHASLQQHPNGRWIVFCEDSYSFAVVLLGVLHSGSTVVLPPNGQPGSLVAVTTPVQLAVRGLITDLPDARASTVLPALGHPTATPPKWTRLDPESPCVELMTSGTTGDRKLAVKTLGQLDAELAVLEQSFGGELEGATVAASVSHQHIYGMLFRVLWPLAAGRPFVAETPVHPDELLAGMNDVARWALISSPDHLRRMIEHLDGGDWSRSCRLVTSSGAPLDQLTAHTWAAAQGRAPLEVLGSTETGGVAWRRQTPGNELSPWTPLSGVALSVHPSGEDGCPRGEGLLYVRSPFGPGHSEELGHCMGDVARMLADGRFHLLGRADRIVKVGGKRLSLAEMEQSLGEDPAVHEAAVVQLDEQRQGRIAAVLVLTERGRLEMEQGGPRALHDHLRKHLLDRFDPITIPRAWQQLETLPTDSNGKLTQAGLRDCFRHSVAPSDSPPTGPLNLRTKTESDRPPLEQAAAWWPQVLDRTRSENECEWQLSIPAEMPVLAGHFPADPIVPGVAQIAWVMEAAAELLGSRRVAQRFEAVKFRSIIRPGDTLTLRVERSAKPDKISYRLFAEDKIFASGHIVFSPVGSDA